VWAESFPVFCPAQCCMRGAPTKPGCKAGLFSAEPRRQASISRPPDAPQRPPRPVVPPPPTTTSRQKASDYPRTVRCIVPGAPSKKARNDWPLVLSVSVYAPADSLRSTGRRRSRPDRSRACFPLSLRGVDDYPEAPHRHGQLAAALDRDRVRVARGR